MPLLAGTQQPTTPSTPGGPRLAPKRITWTAPDGDELVLSDDSQGYRSMPGRSGFGMVPREVLYDSLPGGGGILRNVHDQVRVLQIPLRVAGATQDEYLSRLRRLQRSVRHRRGGEDVPGTITVALPDGSRRKIAAFYNGGLDDHTENMDDLLFTAQTFPRVEFLALDPYWSGAAVGDEWAGATGSTWFGTMPRRLSASQVLGDVTVTLPGDADAYPIWTITGPGAPTLTNTTTGRSLAFKPGSPIGAGRTVTIDTREDHLTVTDDLGADLYGSLEEFPDMWTLEPGVNDLTVEMASATADTRVAFTATVRWQTGW
jgi:hypothetical protein